MLICFPTLLISAAANLADPEKESRLKSHRDHLLSGMQKNLESQKEQVTRTQQEFGVQREQVNARKISCNHYLLILIKNFARLALFFLYPACWGLCFSCW